MTCIENVHDAMIDLGFTIYGFYNCFIFYVESTFIGHVPYRLCTQKLKKVCTFVPINKLNRF